MAFTFEMRDLTPDEINVLAMILVACFFCALLVWMVYDLCNKFHEIYLDIPSNYLWQEFCFYTARFLSIMEVMTIMSSWMQRGVERIVLAPISIFIGIILAAAGLIGTVFAFISLILVTVAMFVTGALGLSVGVGMAVNDSFELLRPSHQSGKRRARQQDDE